MSKLHLSPDSSKGLPRVLCMATELVVSTRKQVSPKKPATFLVAVMPDGSREYISSLFQTARPDQYRFDYQGLTFTFQQTGKGARIVQIP